MSPFFRSVLVRVFVMSKLEAWSVREFVHKVYLGMILPAWMFLIARIIIYNHYLSYVSEEQTYRQEKPVQMYSEVLLL